MTERTVIGDICIMFRRRSEFLYLALTNLDCQAIRKHDFYAIMDKYPEYGMKIKAKAFNRYKDIVRRPILDHKKATYDHIFRLHPSERASTQVLTDPTINDELILLQEMQEKTP